MTLRKIAEKDSPLGIFLGKLWLSAGELQWAQSGATTQGREHCERVEANVLRLFSQSNRISSCTPTVAFILSAAAALHDVGKIARAEGPAVDSDHGREGKRRILDVLAPDLFPNAEFRHIVADIVGVHADAPFTEVPGGERQCNDIDVWPRSLAAVFRLADMLDMTSARAPEGYFRFLRKAF